MTFYSVPQRKNRGVKEVISGDAELKDVLLLVLAELKIMNLYLHSFPKYLNDGLSFSSDDEPSKLRQGEGEKL